MSRLLQAAALATISLSATGCIELPAALLAYELLDRDGEDWIEATPVEGVQGNMRGEMPFTAAFDRELSVANLWQRDSEIELDLHSEGDDWAMLGGGFDRSVLEGSDGAWVALDPMEHWIFGCSGPQVYQAEFDGPPDTVEVREQVVEVEGEEMIELYVRATFEGDSTVEVVVVQPSPNPGGED